ncbi:MAG: hypothetical protein R3C28_29690 [Pirellulaceae bacterium]
MYISRFENKVRLNGRRWWAMAACATAFVANLAECQEVVSVSADDTRYATQGDLPLHVYQGQLTLPSDGLWEVIVPEETGVQECYLVPQDLSLLQNLGSRMYRVVEERNINSGRWQVQMGYEACKEFALKHDGQGPEAIVDIRDDNRWEYIAERWDSKPWQMEQLDQIVDHAIDGPFVFLVPSAKFVFTKEPIAVNNPPEGTPKFRTFVKQEDRTVLAFELRPFIDDGKHWVLYTDGNCERTDIDAQLLERHNAKVVSIVRQADIEQRHQSQQNEYTLTLTAQQPVQRPLELTLRNSITQEEKSLRWALDSKQVLDDVRTSLMNARRFAWQNYAIAAPDSMLASWGVTDDLNDQDEANRNNRGQVASSFAILGGRAAIEETLQLQNVVATESNEADSVDIDSIKGVEVKSHPFDQMLKGQPGGSLEIAKLVPHDRFLVYVAQPDALLPFLDTGAEFIASTGMALSGNSLNYHLQQRYLDRLGMNRAWLEKVLESGLVEEMAMFSPDLYFIDGTDVTVIAKVQQPRLLTGLLSLLGAKANGANAIEIRTPDGDVAHLSVQSGYLFASTNRNELELSLDLLQNGGRRSLGVSAEFRYMLTKLDISDETRLYAYFSDPFIRRLVGPHVKLAQRRRIRTKAKMEAITARAILAKLDGYQADSMESLVRNKYIPDSWRTPDLSIDKLGLVHSDRYGTLPKMKTLPAVPLEKVTPMEAEAYRMYQENYSRYWRQFFDPIALRLNDVGSDQLELATFILPLIDNSIYNGLRRGLAHANDDVPLSVPVVEPAPVLQVSANWNEEAWQSMARSFSEFFSRYSGISSAVLDDFGPGVHMAIFDADPIIAMGSGDVFGAFGGNTRMLRDEMFMVPVALSVLTRPCSFFVETKSPERTRQFFRQAATSGLLLRRQDRDFAVSFHQVGDQDRWVWTLDLFGAVKLRYGVEVIGNYMVVRNIPWTSGDQVVSTLPVELNGAMLQANPIACQKQLPGLFAAATDANRKSVMASLGRLYPMMLLEADVDQALHSHFALFGFEPNKLDTDQWIWREQQLSSAEYGNPRRQRQPEFDPNRPFGMLQHIESMHLNMQFEDDGLRSYIRWNLRK